MQTISGLQKDYLACYLRLQLYTLKTLLENVEDGGGIDEDYASESLRRVEENIRRLRRIWTTN